MGVLRALGPIQQAFGRVGRRLAARSEQTFGVATPEATTRKEGRTYTEGTQ